MDDCQCGNITKLKKTKKKKKKKKTIQNIYKIKIRVVYLIIKMIEKQIKLETSKT
jgi:hypothetical protein